MAETLKDIARRVRDEADIVALIGRTVELKKAGSAYKGLCPFHSEKSPSFTVNPTRGMFHCFGCGEHGSAIDFVMKTERLDFIDALKLLAADLGIELPPPPARGAGQPQSDAPSEDRTRLLRAANEFALEWFRANLVQGRSPVAASYLERRGVSPEVAEKFELGAGVPGWSPLIDAASRKGYSPALMAEAGLAVRSEGGSFYDRFRDRLMFPIRDHMGRLIGFGGRRLDDTDEKSPKYLNSAETPLYSKSNSVYGLSLAGKDIESTGHALLTEGYMDVLMAHQFGFTQAVASLGTALTRQQARLLKRYTARVYFLYDGDAAGRKAMLRGGEALFAAGLDTRVINLPLEHDPDSFLRAEGAEALEARRLGANEYKDIANHEHARAADVATVAGQTELVERCAPLIESAHNEVLREAALGRLAARVGSLPRRAIERLLAQQKRRDTSPDEGAARDRPVAPSPTVDALDSYLLRLMVASFEALEIARHDLVESWLVDPRLEPWILYFHGSDGDGKHLLAEANAMEEPPGDPAVLSAVLARDEPVPHPGGAMRELLARLKRRHHQRVCLELASALQGVEGRDAERAAKILHLLDSESRRVIATSIPRPGE